MESVHARIEARLDAGPTAWTDVSFSNSWVNYGSGQDVQYRLNGDKVELRGRMKDGTLGATAFTLPADFRPPEDESFIQTASGGGIARVTIGSGGTVTVVNAYSVTNAFVSLANISFSITA